MAVVLLSGVAKRFGSSRAPVTAVDDLTLAVGNGEMVVLLGPSGCGKTTTLRLVAGLETPCDGTVEICGRDVRDVPPRHRDVAMVFQDYALYPHLSVYDNLAFGLRMRRIPKAKIADRIGEAVDLLGLAGLRDRKPHELSGGQQQRVAVGRAIVRRPNVFLFDEPLANLDAGARLRMRTEFKRMQRDLGWTAMYVTHDQTEAMAIADRMVVMRAGRVQQIGSPEEVYRRPANRFVAGFVGTPPMNFFEGRLSACADGPVFQTDVWSLALPNGPADRCAGCVALGIRPERVRLSETAPPTASFNVRVTLVEPLGDRANVYVQDEAGVELVAQVSGDATFTVGRQVAASPDLHDACLFETDGDGMRVAPDGGEPSVVSVAKGRARGGL